MNFKKSVQFLLFLLLITLLFLPSCRKVPSSVQSEKENQFRSYILNHKFRASAFYADQPIDYITNDNVVKQETDLWQYVKSYITDDKDNFISNSQVSIEQNALKIPGNDSAALNRVYSISSDAQRVYFDFVDYDYVPRRYSLQEFKDNYFLVYIDWPTGAKVFSKFELVQ